MRLIGVVDVLEGRAVHARAGRREHYAPVEPVAGWPVEPGDPLALARTYIDRLRLAEIYMADLDAILGRTPQGSIAAALATLGSRLWLDAGVSSVEQAQQASTSGATWVIVGLETLASDAALVEICRAVGGDRVALSLDLRDGEPIARAETMRTLDAPAIAARAADTGAAAVIVIDLARVGMGSGLDLDLIARVRNAAPRLALLAGGGVRDLADIVRLAESGCDGVLVATALQNGRIGAAEVAAAQRLSSRSSDGFGHRSS
jgi:phosphoribosylformimino-5-aminoimidazole carboxamide ribotide isomerase